MYRYIKIETTPYKLQLLIVAILLSFSLHSQPKPLQIGDTLPNIQLTNLINYKSSSAQLSDFKADFSNSPLGDGGIILDFWATWCTSCVKKFPFMDSIQKNSDNLRVLLVGKKSTIDTYDRVVSFFEKRKKSGSDYSNLTAVVGDTLLNKYFPHDFIPFYVVLDEHLVVRALLKWDQLNIETLAKITASPQTLR